MIYFTSDLHFYHEKIIRHCNRPFKNVELMNEKIIANWNNVVSPDDEVYILGDVTMEGPAKAFAMLSQLKGIKYLIRGNHDRFADNEAWQQYSWVFRWVKDYHELVWNNQKFVLFHYPIEEWADYYNGAVHLHGHRHNKADYNLEQKQMGLRRYDVGVDANGFTPVSMDTIMVFFK